MNVCRTNIIIIFRFSSKFAYIRCPIRGCNTPALSVYIYRIRYSRLHGQENPDAEEQVHQHEEDAGSGQAPQ